MFFLVQVININIGMGKCSKCGKAILNRRRICTACKSKKKEEKRINTDLLASIIDLNINDSDNITIENFREEEKGDNNCFENILLNNIGQETITDNPTEFEITHLEIDSIYIQLSANNIPNGKANLTLYTNPRVFHIKKELWFKIGWIHFLDTGFQCNILSKFEIDWKKKYEEIVVKLYRNNFTNFFPILPINMDKVVYDLNTFEFIKCLSEKLHNVIFYGKGLKCAINSRYIAPLLDAFSNTIGLNGGFRV